MLHAQAAVQFVLSPGNSLLARTCQQTGHIDETNPVHLRNDSQTTFQAVIIKSTSDVILTANIPGVV